LIVHGRGTVYILGTAIFHLAAGLIVPRLFALYNVSNVLYVQFVPWRLTNIIACIEITTCKSVDSFGIQGSPETC
jgi:hypothetical protein